MPPRQRGGFFYRIFLPAGFLPAVFTDGFYWRFLLAVLFTSGFFTY
jgi:hypothetical protein